VNRTNLAAAVLLAALTGCAREQPPLEEPPIRMVRYVEVRSEGGVRERSFSGAAKAGVETRLSFKVAGTIEELTPKVGDFVQRGELIARLDSRDYELQVQQARAGLAQAKAQAANAEAEFARVRGLYERDNASRGEYDAALAQRDSARAAVDSAQKRLDQAELQLEYTTLRSPVDGSVADVPVEVNENVQQGTPIVVLTAGALPEVEAMIPEVLIGDIRQGQRVPSVTFDAVPNRSFAGVDVEVAVSPTAGLTTYPVTVRLDRRDERIRPGMASEVTFAFPGDNGVRPVLPPHAVGEDRRGRYVFVVQPEGESMGRIERRSVETGELTPSPRFGDAIEVLSGVEDGELVVTAGISKISDGQQVKISEDAAS